MTFLNKIKSFSRWFLCSLVVSSVVICSAPSASFADGRYASLVIDADTGVVLHQEHADEYRYPASLVKMMTLYMTFQAIERGKLSLNKKIRISAHAAAQPSSKMGLRTGQYITVHDAVLSLIIKSANDSAVVLGEAIGGSETQFANMMTRMARKLGMNHTYFKNASGLHNKGQKTTAYDLARLAVALRRDYPKFYHLFNRTKFYYNGRVYNTHNYVTKNYRGADGLKTGYVNAAGFNLVTSARRGGRSIVGVVLGGRTSKGRDRTMKKLLDNAFYKVASGEFAGKVAFNSRMVPVPQLKPGTNVQVEFMPKPKPVSPVSKPEVSSELPDYKPRHG